MRLELARFSVKEVKLGNQTSYKNGALQINKEELLGIVLSDKKVASAELELALPGDKTRIVRVRDAVEPRIKVSGSGCVFPGIMGPVDTVGGGRTHQLSGVTVMVSGEYYPKDRSGSQGENSGVIDMWGKGAPINPFGSLMNIVLVIKLVDNLSEIEAHTAFQMAEFKVAHRLAETTRTLTPEHIEMFELSKVDPALPKVVYDATVSTTWHEPVPNVLYYGLPLRESLATFIHPNALLDGVLTVDARRGNGETPRTWEWMNNPVVLGLLREHGKRVNFLGVILQRTRYEAEWCKHIGGECAAQMAELIGAEGVILTRISPSGNNSMDLMFTIQAFEKHGVKTVFLTPEYGGAEGIEQALWFFAPEADAIVSTSSLDRGVLLAAPNKVIGCEKDKSMSPYHGATYAPWGELELERRALISGGIDYLGHMAHTCELM